MAGLYYPVIGLTGEIILFMAFLHVSEAQMRQ